MLPSFLSWSLLPSCPQPSAIPRNADVTCHFPNTGQSLGGRPSDEHLIMSEPGRAADRAPSFPAPPSGSPYQIRSLCPALPCVGNPSMGHKRTKIKMKRERKKIKGCSRASGEAQRLHRSTLLYMRLKTPSARLAVTSRRPLRLRTHGDFCH